jgi:hypothetical protein
MLQRIKWKLNLFLCLSVTLFRYIGGVELNFHPFLTLITDGDESLASRFGHFLKHYIWFEIIVTTGHYFRLDLNKSVVLKLRIWFVFFVDSDA